MKTKHKRKQKEEEMKQAFIEQDDFDRTIGRLDRILSKLVLWAKDKEEQMDTPNKQTLKHHAEDMIAAGNAILKALGKGVEATPQPINHPDSDSLVIHPGNLVISPDSSQLKDYSTD